MKKILILCLSFFICNQVFALENEYNAAYSEAFKTYFKDNGYSYENSEKLLAKAKAFPNSFHYEDYAKYTSSEEIIKEVNRLLWELQTDTRANTFIWIKSELDNELVGNYKPKSNDQNLDENVYKTLSKQEALSMGFFYSSSAILGQAVSMKDKKQNLVCTQNLNWGSYIGKRLANRKLWPVAVDGEYIKNAFGEVMGMINVSSSNKNDFDVYYKNDAGEYEKMGDVKFTCALSSSIKMLEYRYASCWLCPTVAFVYDAFSIYASSMFTSLGKHARKFMTIMLMFWILFYVGKKFINYEVGDDSMLMGFVKQMFFFSMAFTILGLGNIKFIFDNSVSPIMETAVDFSRSVIKFADVTNVISDECSADEVLLGRKPTNIKLNSTDDGVDALLGENKENVAQADGAFSKSTKDALVCFVANMSQINGRNMAIGATLLKASFGHNLIPILPDFNMFFVGLFIIFIFFMVNLVFGLYIIQIIFNIGIVGVMFPVIVVMWCFEETRSQTSGAIDKIVNSAFSMICLSMVLIFALKSVDTIYLADAYDSSNETLMQAIENDDINALFKATNFGERSFLKIIFLALIMGITLQNIRSVAGKFVGGDYGLVDKITQSARSNLEKIKSATVKGISKISDFTGGGK